LFLCHAFVRWWVHKHKGARNACIAEYRPRFEAFTDILEQIGANKWPVVTYYSFIAFPKEQMFLKPDVTKRAAEACNFELNYRVVFSDVLCRRGGDGVGGVSGSGS
jgi:hypothetical protein